MSKISPLLLLAALLLGGCASNNVDDQVEQETNEPNIDPFEPVNRVFWTFNWDYLDKYILRPVAIGYTTYTPDPVRKGLLNAAVNLEEPASVVSNLLQGKPKGSAVSLGRFVLNSTVGLLGTIDVAKRVGWERQEEELGETFGVWGIGTGPFLMLPGFGPTDIRSLAGDTLDSTYFPLSELNIYVSVIRVGIKALEARAALVDQEQLLNNSLDPYALIREIYFQDLEFKVKDGNVEIPEDELELDDEFDEYLEDL
ncbi:VacJ family lipoprotein [Alteromonadaceae bacterium M269]|nr:VacJ family lipoprotein [Alteromonadaceae bacterium M269]